MTDRDSHYLQRFLAARPGPYGTNEGDLWAMGGDIGERLERENGLLGIWEVMFKDGALGEYAYTVALDNPDPAMQDLMARARAGTDLYIAAQIAEEAKSN